VKLYGVPKMVPFLAHPVYVETDVALLSNARPIVFQRKLVGFKF